MPGSYQHNPDPALAELLHTVCEEGWGNDSIGDVEDDGFAASLLLIEPAEQQELADAFDQPVPAGNFIVHQDRQGVVTVDQHPTPFHARRAFTALAANTGPGEEDATIMPTGPLGAWYAVGLGGRFLGEARDLEQALGMLRAAMDADQVWPDVWFISDHGNPHRLDLGAAMSDRSGDRPVRPDAPAADQPLPLSVWPTAQQPAGTQRTGWYLPASTAHPAKMLPAIARHAIAAYSQPGELVLDPMCGIGTTLVEATRLGRDAVGVELEPRWADLARANLAHACTLGASGTGRVVTGDARQLLKLVGPELTGRVALVVTSPPYGSSLHGQVDARPGRGVVKYDNAYSADRANLGRVGQQALVAALAGILADCRVLLRPGGLLVLTARPWRRREQLVDFPGQLARTAEAAGLVPFERNVALLVGLNGDRLVGRPSFFQLDRVRKARARGLPLRIIAHEDVLVLRRAT